MITENWRTKLNDFIGPLARPLALDDFRLLVIQGTVSRVSNEFVLDTIVDRGLGRTRIQKLPSPALRASLEEVSVLDTVERKVRKLTFMKFEAISGEFEK
jgi:hypothetical protein